MDSIADTGRPVVLFAPSFLVELTPNLLLFFKMLPVHRQNWLHYTGRGAKLELVGEPQKVWLLAGWTLASND
jgi:hypothetical protein